MSTPPTDRRGIVPEDWKFFVILIALGAAYFDLRSEIRGLPRAPIAPVPPASAPPAPPAAGPPPVASPRPQTEMPPRRPALVWLEEPDSTWQCAGTIDSAAIAPLLASKGRGVFDCHQRLAARDPDLRGTLRLRLRIDATGQATALTREGSLNSADMMECVLNELATWRFPQPVGGDCALVELPFAFGLPEGGPASPEPNPAVPR